MFALLQSISPEIFISYNGKDSVFIVNKSSRHNLSQVIKVNTISNDTYCHYHIIPAMLYWKGASLLVFPAQNAYLQSNQEKTSQEPEWGTFNKKKQPVFFQDGKVLKNKKTKELSWFGGDQGVMTTKCWVGSYTESWNQKKWTLEENTAGIRTRPVAWLILLY